MSVAELPVAIMFDFSVSKMRGGKVWGVDIVEILLWRKEGDKEQSRTFLRDERLPHVSRQIERNSILR